MVPFLGAPVVPFRVPQQEQAEAASADCKAYRTALGRWCCGCRCHTRTGAELRARTTAVAIVAVAQNGTSGALAVGKQARRRAARATPRTGVSGQSVSLSLATGVDIREHGRR
jgi:hypothetical protein